MIIFIDLIMIFSLDVFANKQHVSPKLSLVNVSALNKLLSFKIFVSEDEWFQSVHLVLDFEPLSNAFKDVGQAIKAGDPRIHQINVSRPDFLAWLDLPPVDYPLPLALATTTVPSEGIAFSRLSLEAEIDQFHFREE